MHSRWLDPGPNTALGPGSRAGTQVDGPSGQGLGRQMANFRALTICKCTEDLIPEKSN